MKTLLSSFVLATLLILSPADAKAEIPDGFQKGDVNLDGIFDFDDVPALIDVLRSGVYQASADLDCNSVVDFGDVAEFVGLFIID